MGVIGTNGSGAVEYASNDETWLVIPGGFVSSSTHGFHSSASLSNSHLANHGAVAGGLDGVFFEGAGADVWNGADGTIYGAVGVRLGSGGVVSNDGAVVGQTFGLLLNGADSVSNAGIVRGATAAIGVNAPGASVDLVNDGQLAGNRGLFAAAADQITLLNNGTIDAAHEAIRIDAGTASIRNFGTIDGSVFLADGRDVFRNSGTLHGDVHLGGGADHFDGSFGGTADFGIYGDNGRDTLVGGAGNDALYGGNGNDTINGGTGDDIIVGGHGQDVLTGGGSNGDRFVFESPSDSKPSAPDTITDYGTIDLSLIDADTTIAGNQAFHFVIGGFTGAPGELTTSNAPQGYLLSGDTNGDGVADFAIHDLTSWYNIIL